MFQAPSPANVGRSQVVRLFAFVDKYFHNRVVDKDMQVQRLGRVAALQRTFFIKDMQPAVGQIDR